MSLARMASGFLFAVVSLIATDAQSGDCFRKIGIGYSAGYHAPAPFTQSSTCAKLPGWLGWKGACCQPGGTPAGCDCGPCASPLNIACPPACGLPLLRTGGGYTTPCGCGPTRCPTCPGLN